MRLKSIMTIKPETVETAKELLIEGKTYKEVAKCCGISTRKAEEIEKEMNKNFKNAVKRAEKGELREHWLRLHVKKNFRKLGLDILEGPFDTGYDFKGIYNGKKVTIEVERTLKSFIYHKHDPTEVDILIVRNDEATDKVLGMEPAEWKKRLPKKIIKADAEDVIKSTHKLRKDYAIKAEERRKGEEEKLNWVLPFSLIKKAFADLYRHLIERAPLEGTPEAEVFEKVLDIITKRYIECYDINLKKMWEGTSPKIATLANDLVKRHREFTHFTEEEKKQVKEWLNLLHKEYNYFI